MDPTEILSRLGTDTPPTDEELHEARDELRVQLKDAAANREVKEGAALKAAIKVIDDELDARAAAEAQATAEAEALLEGIDEEELDEDTDEDDTEDEPEPDKELLDLTAVRNASRNARSRIDANAQPENPFPHVKVTSIGPAASEKVDHTTSLKDLGAIFSQHARGRDAGRQTLLRMNWDLPEDRQLGPTADLSTRLIDNVVNPASIAFEAIAASGGICGPLPAMYGIPDIGSTGRPVRDALVRFGADRGGVRYIAAGRPSLSSGGVAVWTAENDASPTSPTEKPCPHVECGEECSATVDAITACLTVGNFAARFSPEQWANSLHLLRVRHARLAEQNLLAQIDAGSIAATFQGSPTIQGVLGAVDRGIAAIRSRERLADGVAFRVVLDGWLRNALRDHFTAQRFSGQTGAPGIGDAAINSWFAARGASVTFTSDAAVIGAQTAGALVDFPSTSVIRLFAEGTWLYLDGGTLDLGTEIVDSTLISTNDRMAFMETFEGTAKRTAPCDEAGDDSLRITVDIDPSCICADVVTSP